MLAERLGKAWRARQGEVPLDAVMNFTADGLVLGARTVLAPATKTGTNRTIRLEGREARLVTLLCAAHLRPVPPEALGHIRKATERWSEGDSSLAEVHLALSGMAKLAEPHLAAQRLFLADGLMEAGIVPEAILRALGLAPSVLEALVKDYHTQPRVPSGSGRTSGQWTSDGGAGGGTSAAPASTATGDRPWGVGADGGAALRANLVPVASDARDGADPRRSLVGPPPNHVEAPPKIGVPTAGRPWFVGLTGPALCSLRRAYRSAGYAVHSAEQIAAPREHDPRLAAHPLHVARRSASSGVFIPRTKSSPDHNNRGAW
jgi:hypothetical protein